MSISNFLHGEELLNSEQFLKAYFLVLANYLLLSIMGKLLFMNIVSIKDEVILAQRRVKKYVRETPLEYSPYLSDIGESNVFLKLECLQITGSPKPRGAFNKLLSLSKTQLKKGIITSSTGCLALAFAHALKTIGGNGTIILPRTVAKTKVDALRYYPIKMQFHGDIWKKADAFARKVAKKKGLEYIYPYNDSEIIAGQGTVGIEILKQLKNIDYLFLCVGGGALISGVAGYLKAVKPSIRIVGCWPENAPALYKSIKAGKVIPVIEKETISDGTFTGGIDKGSLTFDLARQLIDDYILVSEGEIKKAINLVLEKHHVVIEGTAGVAVASYLKNKHKYKGKNVVILLCGRNIGIDTLKDILCNNEN